MSRTATIQQMMNEILAIPTAPVNALPEFLDKMRGIIERHMPETPQVIVTVKGGLVQGVDHTPGVEVIVRDYDCDGATVPLKTDEEGHEYVETIW
jgi:hypothetical protein